MCDLTLSRGDSLVHPTTLYQLLNPTTPQDLTGCKVWFTMKKYVSEPDNRAVAQVDSVGGGVVISAPSISGRIIVTTPATATVAFPDTPVILVYDIKVKTPAGLIQTLEFGTVTIDPNVTRAST